MSKTEINFRRLLSAAPNQQNQSKLSHYVATLREQLQQLSQDKSLLRGTVTKAKVNEYNEKIEAVASKLAAQDDTRNPTSPQLRRRLVSTSSKEQSYDADPSTPIKLDTAAQAQMEKRRKLNDYMIDEMLVLVGKFKETCLATSASVLYNNKRIDSIKETTEQSLASMGHANVRVSKISSESSKTSRIDWILTLVSMFVFIMVVCLIRAT